MERVSRETNIPIVTPFSAYTDFGKEYSSHWFWQLTDNLVGKLESVLEESNKHIKVWSISALPLVEEIETGNLDDIIFESLNLELIVQWAQLNKVEGIILGCTHFPYISSHFKRKLGSLF